MIRITNPSKNYWLELGAKLGRLFNTEDKDEGLKTFCKSEYKNDWYHAYVSYKVDGRFPNILNIR